MKIAISIDFLTLSIGCVGLWILSSVDANAINFKFHGEPLPWLTATLIIDPMWILVVPLVWTPFLIILLRNNNISINAAMIFHSTLFCGIVFISIIVFLAGIAPWLPYDPGLMPVK